MESEKRSALKTFHLKAAADVSTWLYRVTHADYESSALTSIGPGILTLPGTSYHLDQAYSLSSIYSTPSPLPPTSLKRSSSSTS
ncbi:hypothetical protein HMI54_012982, partial [Coelomomyces lativittatus]